MEWTFGIPTDGDSSNTRLPKVLSSIEALGIPSFEIILCVEKKNPLLPYRQIEVPEKKPCWISKKKNELLKAAKFENICIVHDYLAFAPGWKEAYEGFKEPWEACSNQVRNLSSKGPRIADWIGWAKGGLFLLPYDMSVPNMFLSGMYFCVKRSFVEKHGLYFDEGKLWGQAEDQEWSKRAIKHTKFAFNRAAMLVGPAHMIGQHFMEMRGVWRVEAGNLFL